MRILITNYHLCNRYGSELYCKELAIALKLAGYEVGVFTNIPGVISEKIAQLGIPIFTTNDENALKTFKPNILHIHHHSCWDYLKKLKLKSKVIFSSLGSDIKSEEYPPINWCGINFGLAISEEVEKIIYETSFGKHVPITIFRNWFDDTNRVISKPVQIRYPPKRIAIVTNHLDVNLDKNLKAIADTHKLKITHFGYPENSVKITADLLSNFDRIITIGRTVQLAGSIGIPCLIYDHHGCDGYLISDRIPELAKHNFSGRLTQNCPSHGALEYLLFEGVRNVDTNNVMEEMWNNWSLSYRVKQLQDCYENISRRK